MNDYDQQKLLERRREEERKKREELDRKKQRKLDEEKKRIKAEKWEEKKKAMREQADKEFSKQFGSSSEDQKEHAPPALGGFFGSQAPKKGLHQRGAKQNPGTYERRHPQDPNEANQAQRTGSVLKRPI